jgi:hypothetical protein
MPKKKMNRMLIVMLNSKLRKKLMRIALKPFKKREKRLLLVSEDSSLGFRKGIKIFQLIISYSLSMNKWRKRSDIKIKLNMKTLSVIFAKRQRIVD